MLPAQYRCAVNFGLPAGGELRSLSPKDAAYRVSVRVNLGLPRAHPLERDGAVQAQGLALELHGWVKPANRDKGSFS